MNKKIKMNISGMCCTSCSNAIESDISKFDFVSKIKIDVKKGKAEFQTVGPIQEHRNMLINTITDLGFTVK